MPKRTSLPSMLPSEHRRRSRDGSDCRRSPRCRRSSTPATNRIIIAARIAQPCFVLPTALPNVQVRPAPSAKIDSIWMKFEMSPGFSNGMRGIGVEEAAAVGAEHLDRDLRCDGPERDDLLGALQRRRGDRTGERLRDAERDQDQRINDADRQQDVERDPGQIGPEIADALRLAPSETADQREGDRDAGRGRQEIVNGQPDHLGEVRHGRFTRIALPVGVGDEADRGVERDWRGHTGKTLRIERQIELQPLDRVGEEHPDRAEHQHGNRIAAPALLLLRLDATRAIECALNRREKAQIFRNAAFVECEQPGAERLRHGEGQRDEQRDQGPAVRRRVGHQNRSGRASTATR